MNEEKMTRIIAELREAACEFRKAAEQEMATDLDNWANRLDAIASTTEASQPVSGAELTDEQILNIAAVHGHGWVEGGKVKPFVSEDDIAADYVAFARAIESALLSASGQASKSEKASTPSDIDLLIALTALHEISWSNDSQWQSDRAKAAIRAFSSTPAQQTEAPVNVPSGWKLVPVEPDLKMVIAGENYIGRHAWVRMLAAAPVPVEQTEAQQSEKDAERYRWLRRQHWNEAVLCVVARPKDAVKLGHDCPSMNRLDEAIDAAIAKEQAK